MAKYRASWWQFWRKPEPWWLDWPPPEPFWDWEEFEATQANDRDFRDTWPSSWTDDESVPPYVADRPSLDPAPPVPPATTDEPDRQPGTDGAS